MTPPTWDRRIERAEKLAKTYPFGAELLTFYAQIARFQQNIYDSLAVESHLDTTLLDPHRAPLLSLVKRIGPKPLAEPSPESDAFFQRVLLQPYMESAAYHSEIPRGNSPSTCPFCGEKPVVGVLREEGDGGKRSLICSLCSTEWEFRRLVCPSCGEEDKDKLAVYTAKEFDYVRIEACESCKTYLKTVDLTRNGLALPVVDELASIPLNLWADEHGYRKLQLNLLSM